MIFESREGYEVASCPTLEGCYAIAGTRRQAYTELRLEVYRTLEELRRDGEELPPSTEFEVLTVF